MSSRNSEGSAGRRGFDDDEPEFVVRLGKKKPGRKACARVTVEFGDGSRKAVKICKDCVEYTEE